MDIQNSLLDDIASEIGYTPTSVLAAWYGGSQIYIPTDENKEDPIAALIGRPAFSRLVREFRGQVLAIPRNAIATRYERWRVVYDLLASGLSTRVVCEETGLSLAHIHNIRHRLEERGILPMIFRKPKNAD